MSGAESVLIWIVSFLVIVLILYINYKISYKFGIKKALYRTTYILLSVMFAFISAPLINDELFNLNLSKFNITLYYKDREFYTIIDYVEEVIVHNEFLNDLYQYFPSLKDLLMDFPQVLLVPITYVLLFFVFMIVFFPLYLYLSYKRKRRILYDRPDNKAHRVWAGVLGCMQTVFVISLVLSPLNGISRIYKNSTNNTLKNKDTSLCEEYAALGKYKVYCDIIELYNSTAFATIGGNDSVSDLVFDSLTRISYDGGYTSLADEASLIVKSGIVLAQSGLLNSVLASSDTISIDTLIENKLTDEDIDIIAKTLSESKYSEDVLLELEVLVVNTLNDLMRELLNDKEFSVEYAVSKEDIINEIKVVLKALTLISNSTLLNDLIVAKDKLIYFVEEFPENRRDNKVVARFIVDLLEPIDLAEFELFANYLFESKIFNRVIPYILDKALGQFGFRFVDTEANLSHRLNNGLVFARVMQKYKPKDFFELIRSLNTEELQLLAELINDVSSSADTQGFVKFLVNIILSDVGVETFFYSDIFLITNWESEVVVLQKFCALAEKFSKGTEINLSDVRDLLEYKDSQLVQLMIKMVKQNSSFFLKELILML